MIKIEEQDLEPRSISELLKIVKRSLIKKPDILGICYEIILLHSKDVITYKEKRILEIYMKDNRPNDTHNIYWWQMGLKRPRTKWLNEHIKLNSLT